MRPTRTLTVFAALACSGLVLAGCSSADEAASAPASAIAAASSAAAAAEDGSNPDMVALCDQMVADGLSPEDATALAEDNGYVARVGTIDGTPQAVTMDFREDRFTFEVTNGVVTACTYG